MPCSCWPMWSIRTVSIEIIMTCASTNARWSTKYDNIPCSQILKIGNERLSEYAIMARIDLVSKRIKPKIVINIVLKKEANQASHPHRMMFLVILIQNFWKKRMWGEGQENVNKQRKWHSHFYMRFKLYSRKIYILLSLFYSNIICFTGWRM